MERPCRRLRDRKARALRRLVKSFVVAAHPAGGFVDVVMDFTDPVIRGMSVFHCHLLNHEDKRMMAKIFFE